MPRRPALAALRSAAAIAALLACALPAVAATNHPWLTQAPRMEKSAHFTNLEDGARIETPYIVRFGLTGFGIAPITKAQAHTGHHHLLFNRDLPLDFSKPLPFTEQYIHFGKGQMETALNLQPGVYTLRLVLADHRHVPNFVYSKPIKVTVTAQRKDIDPASLQKPGVSVRPVQAEVGESTPVQVLFHASALNVSHQALKEKGTGHFRLHVQPEGRAAELMDFAGGETEAWLRPPKGRYTLKLEFVDNLEPGKVLHTSEPATLRVGAL